MSFLTVEDINSILFEYGCVSVFHEIDTSLITDEYDFDGIKYDFVTVSRETDDDEYNYTFKVENKIWTGGYYILDGNGDYIDSNASYDSTTKVLSITADTDTITLVLELNNLPSFSLHRLIWKPLNLDKIKTSITPYVPYSLFEEDSLPALELEILTQNIPNSLIWGSYHQTHQTYIIHKENNIYTSKIPSFEGALQHVSDSNYQTTFYFKQITNYHTPYPFAMIVLLENNEYNYEFVLGKKNRIALVPQTYDINGFTIYCEDMEINSYSQFNAYVDLSNKTVEKNMSVRVHTYAKNGKGEYDYYFVIPAVFLSVDDLSDFTSECGTGGTHTFKLSGDLTLTADVNITHDLRVIGQDHTIDLNGYGFVLSENVKVTFENIDFVDGDTAITQNKGSELILTNCSFTNCVSSNYNNLGSCIYCDVDIESLNNPNDFITVIDNCTFIDNQNCILSGGRLTVTNSRLHNTDVDYLDKHNVAFLYQTDGNATLKYNVFDIDYDTDELCSNEQNIGFAQALIQIGTTARVNGATNTQLLDDNKLPFSDNVYQNASHIFAKYYYPQIEACVYASPVLDKEDKAVCYTVSGENWIWKQNVQVTRASWDSQNEIRKITWED